MESTANALTHMIWRLKKHPEILKKLKDEVSFELPDVGNTYEDFENLVTMENLDELKYLNYFVKEILRTQTPLFDSISYTNKEDLVFKSGLQIPKGTDISFALQLMSKHKWQWKNPEEFIPERFDPDDSMYKTPSG